MKLNLIDIDGTLCESIFNNAKLKNDNQNCLTGEFLQEMAFVQPFKWCQRCFPATLHPFFDAMNVIVTGRMPQHEDLTRDWFQKKIGFDLDGYVSITWNDGFPTREQSYEDYWHRKGDFLHSVVTRFIFAYNVVKIPLKIDIYEDDFNVLTRCYRPHLIKEGVRFLQVIKGEHPIGITGPA